MKLLSEDTSREAQQFLVRRLQSMTPERRLQLTAASIRAGLRVKKPELADMDPFVVAARVTRYLEQEGIDYFLGGSLASTVHGEPRFTQDVDLVIRLKQSSVRGLVREFEHEFYLSQQAILEALQRKTSVNLIHLETNFKIHLMISRERAFEKSRFARKVRHTVEDQSFWFCSAEDIVLVKLEWFRRSGEVLERQLQDVQTVLMVQQSLDFEYLRKWAQILQVQDLLESSLRDADRP